MIRLGNAPVSYGVYGEAAGGEGTSPSQLLASMAEAGYQGSELGPPGFFGTPHETADAFELHGLAAVGAYAPVHFAEDEATIEHDLSRIAVTCGELAAVAERTGTPGLVVLADEGDETLLHNPARDPDDPRERALALDDAGWDRLAHYARTALRMAEDHGLRTSWHPHISTYVESAWEVDRLLESTDVGLTLDIAHLQLAGSDPVECWRRWSARINHIHVKDASMEVLRTAKAERRTDFDTWWANVCVPFGKGDVDIDAFLDAVIADGYDGWLVVEQDREPTPAERYPAVAQEQAHNHQWLAEVVRRRLLR
ncbi:sugar phosphate isomerase/epimerase family protein [Streptomyces iconiensis]|uniref:Sugar phosphate isomerase/epimerase n=1 Tax=Streptomyces iconiensis TaxID=1384038 RepID=A0ABT7A7Q3_9ACTN|nr:sugar phosphate isomerase/epimerase [Streptomyces iconiensis]MDJ1137374.1 sugar phosphate isomerase/epimerase [Streptomyces iconiensis]